MTYNKGVQVRAQNRFGLFYNYMIHLIESDDRICYIACDTIMENSNMRKAMARYPDRIIDVGIAEQNAVDIAVGLTLSGKIAYVVTVSSFLALKTLEQIHTNIAYNDVPVRLVASNSGTQAGATHDAICDVGLLNSIPNIALVVPSCTKHLIRAVEQTVEYPKPIFYKIPQYNDEEIYKSYKDDAFAIGKSMTLRDGNDVCFIGMGAGVSYGFQAAQALMKDNINARVIDMLSFKPIDKDEIIKAAKETRLLVTIEDHNTQNGLASVVSSVLIDAGAFCKVIKFGIPDEFLKCGTLYSEFYKYDGESIARRIKKELNSV